MVHQQQSTQSTYPPPTDARDAAYRVLSQHSKCFPDLLPVDPEVEKLDPRDRALAHAIIRESITRWITLRHIVTQLAGRGFETIEPRMQAVLIGASAQLLLLDRLPPHAVINESVEWAKHYIRPKAGGMINAVLRKVARSRGQTLDTWNNQPNTIPLSNGKALQLNDITLPEDPISYASTLYSIPKATIKRWQHTCDSALNQLVPHTIVHPPTLIYSPDWSSNNDTNKNGKDDDNDKNDDLAPHTSPNHRIYTGSRSHLTRLLDENPTFRVQDPASSAVVNSIPDADYRIIIDYCAGQGTKTRQLAERFPNATIIATEINSNRLDTLMDVFDGNPNILIRHIDELPQTLSNTPSNSADLILTDVPCSNSGVLARRMEARYRPMTPQIDRLVALQQEILATVLPHLNAEGTLVYSTCSIEPEENQHQRDALKNNLGLQLITEHQILPSGLPGDNPATYTDGSYACIFKNSK